MSEAAHLAGRLACGGRRGGWEPAYHTTTLRAAITALPWPGETLPVAAARRGIQLAMAGPSGSRPPSARAPSVTSPSA